MTPATPATPATTATAEARTVRVAIVDDDPRVRQTLREILASDASIRVVGEAGDGRQALALLDRWATEVVVLDVRMPVLDGMRTSRTTTSVAQRSSSARAWRPSPATPTTRMLASLARI